MKNTLFIKVMLLVLLLCGMTTAPIFSQSSDPPPPPSQHGSTNNVPGGGAPIGSWIFLLLASGMGYGVLKVYGARKKLAE
jgi:hypothetical protein